MPLITNSMRQTVTEVDRSPPSYYDLVDGIMGGSSLFGPRGDRGGLARSFCWRHDGTPESQLLHKPRMLHLFASTGLNTTCQCCGVCECCLAWHRFQRCSLLLQGRSEWSVAHVMSSSDEGGSGKGLLPRELAAFIAGQISFSCGLAVAYPLDTSKSHGTSRGFRRVVHLTYGAIATHSQSTDANSCKRFRRRHDSSWSEPHSSPRCAYLPAKGRASRHAEFASAIRRLSRHALSP